MKTVTIDIETTLDEEAAARCGYVPSDEFAPFPLNEVVCASAWTVIGTAKGERFYSLESFSRGSKSERGIIMSLETAVDDAEVFLTFNGYQFDLPVLLARAALHELHVLRLLDMHNCSRVGKHLDLFDQVKRAAAPTSLAQICAPFGIPVKQEPASTVSEIVTREDWAALEHYVKPMWWAAGSPAYSGTRFMSRARLGQLGVSSPHGQSSTPAHIQASQHSSPSRSRLVSATRLVAWTISTSDERRRHRLGAAALMG